MEDPWVSLGWASPWTMLLFLFSVTTLLVERQGGHQTCKKLSVGLLVVTAYSPSCHDHLHTGPFLRPLWLLQGKGRHSLLRRLSDQFTSYPKYKTKSVQWLNKINVAYSANMRKLVYSLYWSLRKSDNVLVQTALNCDVRTVSPLFHRWRNLLF